MSKLLDCSDIDSTFACITDLIGLSRYDLEVKIHSANEDDWLGLSYDELIRQFIFDDKDFCLPEPDIVFWFHTTRVAKGATFKDGLKSTSEMIPQLQEMLADLAEELGICSKRDFFGLPLSGNNARRIAAKFSSGGMDDGPHGFLIKETMMSLYYQAPEFIREYCNALPEKLGKRLLKGYQKRNLPAIVKFQSRLKTRGTTQVALMYLFEKTKGREKLSTFCNCGIGGEKHYVSPADIESIEFLG